MWTLAYHVLNWGMDIETTWDATIMLQNPISLNRLQVFDVSKYQNREKMLNCEFIMFTLE
jgi:hypothetical protein